MPFSWTSVPSTYHCLRLQTVAQYNSQYWSLHSLPSFQRAATRWHRRHQRKADSPNTKRCTKENEVPYDVQLYSYDARVPYMTAKAVGFVAGGEGAAQSSD